jgi:hypothetical protein
LWAAAAALSELLNKTVLVRYTVTIPGRGDDGSTVPGVRNAVRTIYISSAGRAFARVGRADGSRGQFQEKKEAGPGERGNTLQFQGRKLVGNMPFISGASHMEVDFDSSGSSCTAALAVGRDAGRTLRWRGVNGVSYTATGGASPNWLTSCIVEHDAPSIRQIGIVDKPTINPYQKLRRNKLVGKSRSQIEVSHCSIPSSTPTKRFNQIERARDKLGC